MAVRDFMVFDGLGYATGPWRAANSNSLPLGLRDELLKKALQLVGCGDELLAETIDGELL
jgi:hypothetical protein